ncbi:site-2 protease family protein [Candidatus Woesebacteria bacterium]|nr:site-2 protease family protein [Candidatus Woesebacteria bacterium]
MITALTFIAILVLLVLIHEFGHYYAAKKNGVYVEEFGFGFPPRLIGKKIGETLYSFNAIPLGGFVKLFGEEYHENIKLKDERKISKDRAFVNKKPWQKTIIIVAGVVMNFLLGWILLTYLLIAGIPQPAGVAISEVQSGSPASAVGLKSGDKLISLEHAGKKTKINLSTDLVSASSKYAGDPISLTISRNNELQMVTLIPRKDPPQGQGSLGVVITQLVETKKYPWYTAPFHGFVQAADMTRMIAVEIVKIPMSFISKSAPSVEFSGPVGIAKIVGEARQYGLNALLQITAVLSLNLAVINILPFPALDGGRLVFIIYEWVTGKKSNQNLEKYMNLIGIILLLGMSLVITVMDIQKLM